MSAIANDLLARLNNGSGLRGTAAQSMNKDESQWRREMERAQMQNWFRALPQADGKQGFSSASIETASMQLPAHTQAQLVSLESPQVLRQYTLDCAVNSDSAVIPANLGNEIEKPTINTGHYSGLSGNAQALVYGKTTAISLNSSSAQLPPSQTPADSATLHELSRALAAEHPDIRLHTEWSDDGLSVWLGIDAHVDEIEQKIAVLLFAIHKVMRAQEKRLNLVVCNGKIIFSEKSMDNSDKVLNKWSAQLGRDKPFSTLCFGIDQQEA